jgi:hypothetical protein
MHMFNIISTKFSVYNHELHMGRKNLQVLPKSFSMITFFAICILPEANTQAVCPVHN